MAEKKKYSKRTVVGIVLLGTMAVLTVLSLVFYGEIYTAEGWFQSNPTHIPAFDWLLALAPRLFGCCQTLFITLLVIYVLSLTYAKIFRGTPRRLTIGALVMSISRVVVWVVCVIAILAIWGVDVAALIAGAGVLTLVIGLGMQSLIADVVAGVFLVCDGTLQVGDIVTIDGWRGTVQEIGIRNTKLINYSGDIRVANNSTIKVFVNQSRENSYPTVIVGVPYEENLQHVKEVFEANKQRIREMCPALIGDIDFNGVDALASSSVDLHFGATCKESDFFAAQRQMRGAIKTVFEENGILVPFPQVDVHMPDQT